MTTSLKLKPYVETYRDDFSYANSPAAIARFPFPFPEDEYMYSVNVEPHVPKGSPDSVYQNVFDLDEHYLSEVEERKRVLADDPRRYAALPHMMPAQWDTLELAMESLVRDYPEHFSLARNGDAWKWQNRLLGIEQEFTFGDPQTLPQEPFEYITRQLQGDFNIMDQRNDNLYMDAGMITGPADWSLQFDLGMDFVEWHTPVPDVAHQLGVFERARKFLLHLKLNEPVRRLNWTMTVNPRLDTSSERYNEWGVERSTVTPDNVGEVVHLRVELQALWRLPRSNGILFSIRTYLINMNDLVTVPKWAKRMHRVLKTLPQDLVDYKGLSRYRDVTVDWLSTYDDGSELTPDVWPD